ncbi:uncharacterized protein LOC115995973 [Ipomoea triloba]|uniref:uncharacterized protein LOC115995973 n=1 Tax=Ipomoea triloba TaxID=35885 RepID=UPI00125D37DC|nr:uncharacterized protein LOC115995973 [Ipomoea triloba]
MKQVHTRFEELRMKDEQTIVEFNARVQELKNEAAVLGEPFSSDKLVRKILRSLPIRFRMKVTAIQENNNKKGKNVAFIAERCDLKEEIEDLDDETIVMITRNFSKILKQINRKNKGVNQVRRVINRIPINGKHLKIRTRITECEGFGHIHVECETYLKRKKSIKATTWSDKECSEEAQEDNEEISGNFVAFTVALSEPHPELENDSDHDEVEKLLYEELEQSYVQLYKKWDILLKSHITATAKNGITAFVPTSVGHGTNIKFKQGTQRKYTPAKWYFDSGCSRHMTGNKKYLKDIIPYTGQVTFGDGIKGDIKGIGILNVAGLPSLNKVLLVRGLKATLISISQLCDQKLNVGFTKDRYIVKDQQNKMIMEGQEVHELGFQIFPTIGEQTVLLSPFLLPVLSVGEMDLFSN